jgi:hypothetical protein
VVVVVVVVTTVVWVAGAYDSCPRVVYWSICWSGVEARRVGRVWETSGDSRPGVTVLEEPD